MNPNSTKKELNCSQLIENSTYPKAKANRTKPPFKITINSYWPKIKK